MSLYLFCFCLGFAGFLITTLLGLSHSHSAGKHAHLPSPAKGSHAHGPGKFSQIKGAAQSGHMLFTLLGLPRTVFSLCFGFGSVGLLLQNTLHGVPLFFAAAGGAFVFDRLALTPIWTFLFRFASSPARTLEDLVLEEAEAVTAFDVRGEGLVLVYLDGRAVQILARLDRSSGLDHGARIRSGDRLSIIAVDAKRNSCTVIPLRTRLS